MVALLALPSLPASLAPMLALERVTTNPACSAIRRENDVAASQFMAAPAMCRKRSRSTVARLFRAIRPAAIFEAVVAVIVDAINRMAPWGLAHVRKEILKHAPPRTHFDASRTIIRVADRVRVLAPLAHRHPAVVGPRPALTVSRQALHQSVDGEAPAGARPAGSQLTRGDKLARPAGALAQPTPRLLARAWDFFDGCQPAENLAGGNSRLHADNVQGIFEKRNGSRQPW
jgi:hypothetical protein